MPLIIHWLNFVDIQRVRLDAWIEQSWKVNCMRATWNRFEKKIQHLHIADDSTCDTRSSIASYQWVGWWSFAQIVNILMDNHSATNDIPWTGQWDQRVRKCCVAQSICIANNIPQITNMSFVSFTTGVMALHDIQSKRFQTKCSLPVSLISKWILLHVDYNERRD